MTIATMIVRADGTPVDLPPGDYMLRLVRMPEAVGETVGELPFTVAGEPPVKEPETPIGSEPQPQPEPEPEPQPEPEPEPIPDGPGVSTATIPRNARVGDTLAEFVYPGLPAGVTWTAALDRGGEDNDFVTIRAGRTLTLGKAIPSGKSIISTRVEFRTYRGNSRLGDVDREFRFDVR